jgi:hypothetical protein
VCECVCVCVCVCVCARLCVRTCTHVHTRRKHVPERTKQHASSSAGSTEIQPTRFFILSAVAGPSLNPTLHRRGAAACNLICTGHTHSSSPTIGQHTACETCRWSHSHLCDKKMQHGPMVTQVLGRHRAALPHTTHISQVPVQTRHETQ